MNVLSLCMLRLTSCLLCWISPVYIWAIDCLVLIISDCRNIDTVVANMFIMAVEMGAAFRGVFIPFQACGCFLLEGERYVWFLAGRCQCSFSTECDGYHIAFYDATLCDQGN